MPKRKSKHQHEYGDEHKGFVLGHVANQTPYNQIRTLFKQKYGWKIPLGTITLIKSRAIEQVEQKPSQRQSSRQKLNKQKKN